MAILVPKSVAYPGALIVGIFGLIIGAIVFYETPYEYLILLFWGPYVLVFAIITYNYSKHGHELGTWGLEPGDPNIRVSRLLSIIIWIFLLSLCFIGFFYEDLLIFKTHKPHTQDHQFRGSLLHILV